MWEISYLKTINSTLVRDSQYTIKVSKYFMCFIALYTSSEIPDASKGLTFQAVMKPGHSSRTLWKTEFSRLKIVYSNSFCISAKEETLWLERIIWFHLLFSNSHQHRKWLWICLLRRMISMESCGTVNLSKKLYNIIRTNQNLIGTNVFFREL